MQDIRIRIAAAIFLSIATFISLTGAAAVFLWWLLFCHSVVRMKNVRLILFPILLAAFFSFIIVITGGNGIPYFIRMAVLMLIGMWLYLEYKPGEFPDLCVWLFGDGVGFELGMIAEMGMQWVGTLFVDVERIQIAEKLKGIRWGLLSIIPAGNVLVHSSLERAEDTAELLAARGYRFGGTRCPVFRTSLHDLISATAVIIVGIASFVPVSEFFILYR